MENGEIINRKTMKFLHFATILLNDSNHVADELAHDVDDLLEPPQSILSIFRSIRNITAHMSTAARVAFGMKLK